MLTQALYTMMKWTTPVHMGMGTYECMEWDCLEGEMAWEAGGGELKGRDRQERLFYMKSSCLQADNCHLCKQSEITCLPSAWLRQVLSLESSTTLARLRWQL